ncbi:conserved hypothetical protein [Methanolacinia petrolearia DSM 11571]|uniref:Uncharacterized protein n=1 Tax=Methanolacinia petrolearia (strain DSM 11571 / OCM 486 / SEBR 4847) TaxID=679926 RepID=E1RID6_METP4|nr:hypothetical protein [Methanolacinia petrolearia]ADN35449.1 conserved hypothetical protein [Methanolacinia petrolearia DSM 11571]
MNTLEWIKANFARKKPDRKLARKSIRHLKKIEKKQLFSEDMSQMRASEGRWYESLIYEMLLEISGRSDMVKYIVRKGADAPFPPPEIEMGQNGLFYSNRGDINIRGNGQDIAEVDILWVDNENRISFAEIVTSASDLKDLEVEVHYKKRLLGYLYGQVIVPFVLFSSVDISRSSIIRRLVKETESVVIITPTCEEIKTLLTPSSIRGVPRKPVNHPKLIDIADIPLKRPFDYLSLHNKKRDKLIGMMLAGKGKEEMMKRDEIPPVSKKIIIGALYPSGIKALMQNRTFTMRGKIHSIDSIERDYSKIVLAIDIPEYEPVIYMKSRMKEEYVKIVRKKSGELKVESKRTPQMTGFYLWLESLKPTIGAKIAVKYGNVFLRK